MTKARPDVQLTGGVRRTDMPASANPPLGDELAGYRIEALLGRGGMGVVYRAPDLAPGAPGGAEADGAAPGEDPRFRERFLRESRIAASLEHPNVVAVHDAGEVDGALYIAMRYVEGRTSRALLRGEGALAPDRRVGDRGADRRRARRRPRARARAPRREARERAASTRHEHVVPGRLRADQARSAMRRLDRHRPVVGTLDYVAPEQIRGEPVDGRADVYALGCVLFECLTGEPPFRRGSDTATLFAQLEDDPPTLPGLEEVLPKALAKDPADRYPTCGQAAADAREALGSRTETRRWPLPSRGRHRPDRRGNHRLFLTQGAGPPEGVPGGDTSSASTRRRTPSPSASRLAAERAQSR